MQRRGLFSEGEIQRFIIPARTRRHREAKKERLTVEESDRLVRMARVQALAEDVFGDPDDREYRATQSAQLFTFAWNAVHVAVESVFTIAWNTQIFPRS